MDKPTSSLTEKQENNMETNKEMEANKSFNIDLFKFIGHSGNQSSFYWFNDETAKLEEVRITSVVCHLLEGSVKYNLDHCGDVRQVVARKDYDSRFELQLYKSEDDYIKGNSADCSGYFHEWKFRMALGRNFAYRKEGNEMRYYSYTIKDGKPTEIALMDCVNKVIVSFDEQNATHYSFDKEIDLNHCYCDKDELFKYESVCVADNDGSMHFTDAPMSILRLTNEQKKLLDDFLGARKALAKAGVKLVFDSDEWRMYAINGNNLESMRSDEPVGDFRECLTDGVLRIDELHDSLRIDFEHDAYFNSDVISVLCKLKERKQ